MGGLMGTKRPHLYAVGDADDARSTVHVGNRLRLLREQAGLSQEVAAVTAGLTRNTLGRLESMALPDMRLSTALALMDLYGLQSIEELFGRTPSRAAVNRWVEVGRPGRREKGAR